MFKKKLNASFILEQAQHEAQRRAAYDRADGEIRSYLYMLYAEADVLRLSIGHVRNLGLIARVNGVISSISMDESADSLRETLNFPDWFNGTTFQIVRETPDQYAETEEVRGKILAKNGKCEIELRVPQENWNDILTLFSSAYTKQRRLIIFIELERPIPKFPIDFSEWMIGYSIGIEKL